jgi:cytidylate kinase
VTVRRVVAIDGGAGSGKSTLARGLARRLGLPYVNTGEMYRALAAASRRAGVDPDDADGLLELARGLRFTLSGAHPGELEVEGWTRAELHTADVESRVSTVAAHPAVRAHLRDAQRALAEQGAVMEGRDIASVVVPDAPVKIFVTADAATRARRRATERGSDRPEAFAEALRARDARDARTNPLEPAKGAAVIDTTDLDIDSALGAAVAIVRRLAPELLP